jgi:DNA-binding transcriptional LysR family regulator
MELLQLRYFQKVAELESVTKAARYFSIPQPSMSQAIGRLERDLNTRLFERRNGKLFLNEKGRAFLEAVERSLQELDNGMATITGDAGKISGPINIKVMENHRFILASIPKFAKMYPDVRISVSHGYYEDQDVSYDLCISSKPSYKHMTASVPLIRERVVLAVHEDHPFASREAVSIADLQGQKLISLPAPTELYEQTLKLCRARGFEPLIPIICDDPYFVRKYVSENMGIALAPSISWQGRFRANTVLVPVVSPEIYISSYLIWDDAHYESPAVLRFRDFLLAEAKQFSDPELG